MTTRAMTKTAVRAVNSRIRALQRDRKDTLAGRWLPWGLPWCKGPASEYHQEPLCEGCLIRSLAEDEAARIADRIRQLQASLAPAEQGALF